MTISKKKRHNEIYLSGQEKEKINQENHHECRGIEFGTKGKIRHQLKERTLRECDTEKKQMYEL